MSEMALTADQIVVIGKGRLISAGSTAEFIAESSGQFVRVRSPHLDRLEQLLRGKGALLRREPDGALAVSAMSAPEIGDLAGTNGIFIHELATQSASLEEAYMELTRDSVEFHGEPLPTAEPPPPLATSAATVPATGSTSREQS
jgi:ABC-2 type transport system ATP-binding protein